MSTVDEVIEAIRKLSPEERERVTRELEKLTHPVHQPPAEAQRVALREFIRSTGTIHSDHTDVSSDKYRHLADGYFEKHHGQ